MPGHVLRLLLLCVMGCGVAYGAPSTADLPPLPSYYRATFPVESGAPTSAEYMVQTDDGSLWFLANDLHRSDGVGFQRIAIAGNRAAFDGSTQVFGASNNGVWVAYAKEGVALVRNGKLTRFGPSSGLPANKRVSAVIDRGSKVLAATMAGLFAFDGKRWREMAPTPELSGQPITDAMEDTSGQLWILIADAAYYRPRDGGRYRRIALPKTDMPLKGLKAAPDGSIWYWNYAGPRNLCRVYPDPRPVCWNAGNIQYPLFDRDGALWWMGPEHVLRVNAHRQLDPEDPDAPLKQAVRLEGRGIRVASSKDGSVWILGAEGISRLVRPTLWPTRTPTGGIVQAGGGDVWLVSFNRGLMRVGPVGTSASPWLEGQDGTVWSPASLHDAGVNNPTANNPSIEDFKPIRGALASDEVAVIERHATILGAARLDRDVNGDLYAGRIAPSSLTRFRHGRAEDIAIPPLDTGAVIIGAKRDPTGALWIGVARNSVPLYKQVGTQWLPNGSLKLPPGLALSRFAFDGDGTLWIGAGADGVFSATSGRVRHFGQDEGLDVGLVGDVYIDDGIVWVAGVQGIALRKADRFVTLVGQGGERFRGVSGMVHLPNGDVWMAGTDGITHIAASEWRRALKEPGYTLRFLRLDRWDGVASSALRGPYPTAARSQDGTLWFAMRTGLYRMRPSDKPQDRAPPEVVLSAWTLDGSPVSTERELEIPPGNHRLLVRFLAPGADHTERTMFRYRVTQDGSPGTWEFLGRQRQLSIERLEHGVYALEFQASARDGSWPEKGTVVGFRVLPAFRQTGAFYLLVTTLGLGLLAVAYLARVRQISARIRSKAEVRMRERERIARDLHDTLLQSIQGLLLSFQSIAGRLSPQDPMRLRMEEVLNRTEQALREGRDRVSELRDAPASTLDLPELLQRHARDLTEEHRLLCIVDVPLPPRPLQPMVYEELRQIGREAITNACLHSRGACVEIRLTYCDAGVVLMVQDDGIGIPEERLGVERHWGLKGMRERTLLMSATLSITVRPGGGTEVKVGVGADAAYPKH